MADLRGKLETYELELNGAEASAAANARSKEVRGSGDRLAIAADWFKSPADKETSTAAASGAASGNSRESKLLDAALAGNGSAASASRVDPKSPEAERTRKAAEDEIARIKGELAQLSGACTAPKK
jgi:hypothetical protein